MPTVLLVDDEIDLREAMAFDFRRKNFTVLTASGGNEAFEIIKVTHVDIVLSDVRMANGDGLELLDKIKARDSTYPVVFLITGFSDLTVEQAYEKGADAVFSKPFDRKALFDAIIESLRPPGENLLRKTPRLATDFAAGLHFKKGGFTVQTRIKNLGRGGFFAALTGRFPEQFEPVQFKINTESPENVLIEGEGVVRWVREYPLDRFQAGCGIEFVSLEKESFRALTELYNFLKTKSFIPRA